MAIVWCQSDGREMWRSADRGRLRLFVAERVRLVYRAGERGVGKPFACPAPGLGRTIPGEAPR